MSPTKDNRGWELVSELHFCSRTGKIDFLLISQLKFTAKIDNEIRKTRNCRSAKVYFQYHNFYYSRPSSRLFKREFYFSSLCKICLKLGLIPRVSKNRVFCENISSQPQLGKNPVSLVGGTLATRD